MSEFSSRIEVQRSVLRAVNSKGWSEKLYGLSAKAIQRWIATNRIEESSRTVTLVRLASQEMSLLANFSLEAISEEYKSSTENVAKITVMLEDESLCV